MDERLIEEAKSLEAEAERLRFRARWGDEEAYWEAGKLVDGWLSAPEMWGTHGAPGDSKIDRLVLDIGNALIRARGVTP